MNRKTLEVIPPKGNAPKIPKSALPKQPLQVKPISQLDNAPQSQYEGIQSYDSQRIGNSTFTPPNNLQSNYSSPNSSKFSSPLRKTQVPEHNFSNFVSNSSTSYYSANKSSQLQSNIETMYTASPQSSSHAVFEDPNQKSTNTQQIPAFSSERSTFKASSSTFQAKQDPENQNNSISISNPSNSETTSSNYQQQFTGNTKFVITPPEHKKSSFEKPFDDDFLKDDDQQQEESFTFEVNDEFSSNAGQEQLSDIHVDDFELPTSLFADNNDTEQSKLETEPKVEDNNFDIQNGSENIEKDNKEPHISQNDPITNKETEEKPEVKIIAGFTIEKSNKKTTNQQIDEEVQSIPEDMLEDMLDIYQSIDNKNNSNENESFEICQPRRESLSIGKRTGNEESVIISSIDEDDFDPLNDMMEFTNIMNLSDSSDILNSNGDPFSDIPVEALKDMLEIEDDETVEDFRSRNKPKTFIKPKQNTKLKPIKSKKPKPQSKSKEEIPSKPKKNFTLETPKVQELNLPKAKTITLDRKIQNVNVIHDGGFVVERRTDLNLIVSDFSKPSSQQLPPQQNISTEKFFNTRPTEGTQIGQKLVGQTKSFEFNPNDLPPDSSTQTPKISSFDFQPLSQTASYQAPSSLSSFATKQSIFNNQSQQQFQQHPQLVQNNNPYPQIIPPTVQQQFISPVPPQQQIQQQLPQETPIVNEDPTKILKEKTNASAAPIELIEELKRLRHQVNEQEKRQKSNTLPPGFAVKSKGPLPVLPHLDGSDLKTEGFLEPETFGSKEDDIDEISFNNTSNPSSRNSAMSSNWSGPGMNTVPPPPVITMSDTDVSPTKRHIRTSMKDRKNRANNKSELILMQKTSKSKKNTAQIFSLIAICAILAIILGIMSFYFMPSVL
ncbi:hypothetical protein TVAG_055660 [Trichomonas vaginalis G3]|uniref:Uncharacterized protein n=1 Tax=Trichomonas vaginalis (strain ATCC PRA-98 / G3) TaxID=412133 RepID=A2EY09_TRIV3|nr:hypothetical protein TVAGG3_0730320 [Trichomonas vaginalis G3]EAY02477.1 hypothetical protein TVAG_055660 [Trichomonas vaginalis G3]KAI5511206.1 hypothetical protein TVAGG3_0730320 [Trichomonas vaginalis G3]|eukprot:XP_001314716.1 hypothetical protein [Trichomonas vaginalis G3]